MSDFFVKNRAAYYDALTIVRNSDDIEHWIKFFLVGLAETCKKGKATFEKIIDLRHKSEEKIITLGKRAKVGLNLLKELYAQPVLSVGQIAEALDISFMSASTLAKDFQKLGILTEITDSKRNRLFAFTEYIALFEK
jgi:Fic family protein